MEKNIKYEVRLSFSLTNGSIDENINFFLYRLISFDYLEDKYMYQAIISETINKNLFSCKFLKTLTKKLKNSPNQDLVINRRDINVNIIELYFKSYNLKFDNTYGLLLIKNKDKIKNKNKDRLWAFLLLYLSKES